MKKQDRQLLVRAVAALEDQNGALKSVAASLAFVVKAHSEKEALTLEQDKRRVVDLHEELRLAQSMGSVVMIDPVFGDPDEGEDDAMVKGWITMFQDEGCGDDVTAMEAVYDAAICAESHECGIYLDGDIIKALCAEFRKEAEFKRDTTALAEYKQMIAVLPQEPLTWTMIKDALHGEYGLINSYEGDKVLKWAMRLAGWEQPKNPSRINGVQGRWWLPPRSE